MNAVIPLKKLPSPHFLSNRLSEIEKRMDEAHATHLGYPYNLAGAGPVPARLGSYLINNLGDPYVGSHYASEVCDLEREAVHWFMDLWQCANCDDYWGSIGASGTEGNLWALYLAREALPNAKLIYAREAHYSIPKSARILHMDSICVDCMPDGSIDLKGFEAALNSVGNGKVIVALTCGTTVKGAHDDIGAIVAALEDKGIGRERRFVHVDGALNAMVLPFSNETPFAIRPSFRHAIDSISTSGHKMVGTAMPCGVLVARREHVDRIASAIAYLRSNDTTLMGSRNGHAVLAVWSRAFGHGRAGYTADVAACIARASTLEAALKAEDVPVLRNPLSLTVLFPQPSESIVRTYQLACSEGTAHAITMPNVTDSLIERFSRDYLVWWKGLRNTHISEGVLS